MYNAMVLALLLVACLVGAAIFMRRDDAPFERRLSPILRTLDDGVVEK